MSEGQYASSSDLPEQQGQEFNFYPGPVLLGDIMPFGVDQCPLPPACGCNWVMGWDGQFWLQPPMPILPDLEPVLEEIGLPGWHQEEFATPVPLLIMPDLEPVPIEVEVATWQHQKDMRDPRVALDIHDIWTSLYFIWPLVQLKPLF
ncbi:hypothetical protein CspHIS471_0106720 [Cutaneotrichosporon sp. HIS471]|nr:hypothetical protein CspHIS471_0106720 [Cutaneotrichosporon sp. HIS471]